MAPPFMISTQDRGERSVACPDRFNRGENDLGIHWIGGWESPRVGIDAM
jgi:hypothetical protein